MFVGEHSDISQTMPLCEEAVTYGAAVAFSQLGRILICPRGRSCQQPMSCSCASLVPIVCPAPSHMRKGMACVPRHHDERNGFHHGSTSRQGSRTGRTGFASTLNQVESEAKNLSCGRSQVSLHRHSTMNLRRCRAQASTTTLSQRSAFTTCEEPGSPHGVHVPRIKRRCWRTTTRVPSRFLP